MTVHALDQKFVFLHFLKEWMSLDVKFSAAHLARIEEKNA
jgi:hypothetical protein